MLPAAWCDLKGTWAGGLPQQPIKRTAFDFKARSPGREFAFPSLETLFPLKR